MQRRKQQPTPVPLPGKSHERRSLVSNSPCGCKESDTTEPLLSLFMQREQMSIDADTGNWLVCSENGKQIYTHKTTTQTSISQELKMDRPEGRVTEELHHLWGTGVICRVLTHSVHIMWLLYAGDHPTPSSGVDCDWSQLSRYSRFLAIVAVSARDANQGLHEWTCCNSLSKRNCSKKAQLLTAWSSRPFLNGCENWLEVPFFWEQKIVIASATGQREWS